MTAVSSYPLGGTMLRLKRHAATGDHYNASEQRWQAWCEDCGKNLYGYDDWDEDRGPVFIGWFHESLSKQGARVGSTSCQPS